MGRSPASSTGRAALCRECRLAVSGPASSAWEPTVHSTTSARFSTSTARVGRRARRRPDQSPQSERLVHVQREHVPTRRLPFLGLSVNGETRILALRSIRGIEAANDIEYWGHYPVADLQYETDLPVSAGLRAWSNFFPGDGVASNAPAAIFEVRLANDSDRAQSGTLAFSFEGPRELDIGIPANIGETIFERQPVNDSISGVTVVAERDGIELGYALAVVGDQHVRLGAGLGSSATKWNGISTELPAAEAEDPGASIAVDFELPAGETKTVRFVLAWYAPVWRSWYGTPERFARRLAQPEYGPAIHWEQLPERRYVNIYQSRFSERARRPRGILLRSTNRGCRGS